MRLEVFRLNRTGQSPIGPINPASEVIVRNQQILPKDFLCFVQLIEKIRIKLDANGI